MYFISVRIHFSLNVLEDLFTAQIHFFNKKGMYIFNKINNKIIKTANLL